MPGALFDQTETIRLALARRIAMDYSALPQVEAVALAGSQSTGTAGPDSDLDFYVYVHEEIPMPERQRIAVTSASYAEVGNQFWEPGDEAAFFASYFDLLFALNCLPHPGEKRLVYWVAERCTQVPVQMAEQVQRILHAGATANPVLLAHLHALLDNLDDLLRALGWEGMLAPERSK